MSGAGPGRTAPGYAILIASLIGLVGMSAASGLIGDTSVHEARAIDESLYRVRAYWAGIGHATYVLSRGRHSGLCGGTTCDQPPASGDDVRALSYEGFARELLNAVPVSGSNTVFRTGYAEVSTDYWLDVVVNPQKTIPTDNTTGRLSLVVDLQNDAGWAGRTLDGTVGQLPDFEIRFCVGQADGNACETTLADTDVNGYPKIIGMLMQD